jgi:hypothetical protein
VSEYQYYEFQAVDRPLANAQVEKLRQVSSRAAITPTRFVNEYHWDDFKGDPFRWMERYFDAFLYLANWGTHELMLRFPGRLLDLETARLYCPGDDVALASESGGHVILSFTSECDGCGEVEEGDGWLADILPVRAEIASGDHRALYLAWLLWMESAEADEPEPPVPPGLKRLTGAQAAFAEFLRVDRDLVAAAAERSAELADAGGDAVGEWIAALGEAEKTAFLVDVARGAEGAVRAALVRRFRASRRPAGAPGESPRTAGELRARPSGGRRSGSERERSGRRAPGLARSRRRLPRGRGTSTSSRRARRRHGAGSTSSSPGSSPGRMTKRWSWSWRCTSWAPATGARPRSGRASRSCAWRTAGSRRSCSGWRGRFPRRPRRWLPVSARDEADPREPSVTASPHHQPARRAIPCRRRPPPRIIERRTSHVHQRCTMSRDSRICRG